jgi:ribonuclease HI
MERTQPDAILAFTDGACSGNPGPAGIGVVLVCGAHRKEISEYIGS